MLPVPEPIGYGRWPGGVSDATAIHDNPTPTSATAAPASTSGRRRAPAAATHIAARAGSATSASASLTLKASPTNPAAVRTQTARRVCSPRTDAHNAPTRSAVITESIVSLRAVSTEIGRTASAAPAKIPACQP
jgi:hypothetical protein